MDKEEEWRSSKGLPFHYYPVGHISFDWEMRFEQRKHWVVK